MDIIVEIGAAEQRELIRQEISTLEVFGQRHELPSKILVPADFDSEINRLQGTSSYRSCRGHHTAFAKALFLGDDFEFVLVLSPALYTECHDACMRFNTYFHEMFHSRCHRRADIPAPTKMVPDGYRYCLYSLYDEYQAVRASYELSFHMPKGTIRFQKETCRVFKYHSDSLVDPETFYRKMNSEIVYYEMTGDAKRFNSVYPTLFEQCAIDFAYTFAILDAIPHFAKYQDQLSRSPFVRRQTVALIDYFREKYRARSCDLEGGVDLMVEFYKCFGLYYCIENGNELLHTRVF